MEILTLDCTHCQYISITKKASLATTTIDISKAIFIGWCGSSVLGHGNGMRPYIMYTSECLLLPCTCIMARPYKNAVVSQVCRTHGSWHKVLLSWYHNPERRPATPCSPSPLPLLLLPPPSPTTLRLRLARLLPSIGPSCRVWETERR